ncbi:MAG: hypothetical protein CVV41_11085 [Candidatus Riflebacteria bacterium HGW-Riflebacteria-1]|jgi:prepilin-type N-terminal cleavage/methylation domain-containing protein|nr:MAG: hypothetical protein CVV41_11085 [Candidatus Riflebacteria bacterium HGW-Riflebacteria-1]
MKCAKKAGFTLVEILVAATILSVLLLIGYRVFVSFSRSFQQGSWSLATQNKLRNALTFVREEMQKATPMTTVSFSGTEITETGYEFYLTAAEELTGDGKIAEWHICLPYVTSETSGARFKCELKLDGGRIIYTKTLEDGSDPENKERTFSNHTVIGDVASIKIDRTFFDPDDPPAGSLVSLDVRVEHPDKHAYEFAHVIAESGAKVEVEVKRTL